MCSCTYRSHRRRALTVEERRSMATQTRRRRASSGHANGPIWREEELAAKSGRRATTNRYASRRIFAHPNNFIIFHLETFCIQCWVVRPGRDTLMAAAGCSADFIARRSANWINRSLRIRKTWGHLFGNRDAFPRKKWRSIALHTEYG